MRFSPPEKIRQKIIEEQLAIIKNGGSLKDSNDRSEIILNDYYKSIGNKYAMLYFRGKNNCLICDVEVPLECRNIAEFAWSELKNRFPHIKPNNVILCHE